MSINRKQRRLGRRSEAGTNGVDPDAASGLDATETLPSDDADAWTSGAGSSGTAASDIGDPGDARNHRNGGGSNGGGSNGGGSNGDGGGRGDPFDGSDDDFAGLAGHDPFDGSDDDFADVGAGDGSGGTAVGGRVATRPRPAPARAPRVRPRQFLHEVNVELRKVAWPTRAETINYSSVVLVTLAVLMALIFGLDYGFNRAAIFLFK